MRTHLGAVIGEAKRAHDPARFYDYIVAGDGEHECFSLPEEAASYFYNHVIKVEDSVEVYVRAYSSERGGEDELLWVQRVAVFNLGDLAQ